jgi:hypothetical protein
VNRETIAEAAHAIAAAVAVLRVAELADKTTMLAGLGLRLVYLLQHRTVSARMEMGKPAWPSERSSKIRLLSA